MAVLPANTYYRLADAALAASTPAALIDAIFAALNVTKDWLNRDIPSTHLWTPTKRGTSEAVTLDAPVGTAMALNPKILLAAHGVTTGTPASPDSWLANALHANLVLNPGAYSAWNNPSPYTSGRVFNYWRAAGTGVNLAGALVRTFVSQEAIFWQILQTATTQYWIKAGAIYKPCGDLISGAWGNRAESDGRIYGLVTTGTVSPVGAIGSANGFMDHSSVSGDYHGGMFQIGQSGILAVGRDMRGQAAASSAMFRDADNQFVARPVTISRSTGNNLQNGVAVGVLRDTYYLGAVQSGQVVSSSAGNLHVISRDTTGASDAIGLRAAA